ncbi:IQ domain-containing protein H-like isoform X2 [Tubulanus polymorphus]|uniref:IQ domain-containing protein H-like isoform X2 n=1 Tax=Tubulanus polymorphus TaxID=672921 RepID=UPI003DA53810
MLTNMPPSMSDYNNQSQHVGELLIRVQEDLHHLREKVNAQKDGRGELNIDALDDAIEKTENEIKAKTEQLVNQMNNQVLTLPSLESQAQIRHETTWDLRNQSQPSQDYVIRTTGAIDARTLPKKTSILPKEKLQTKGPTPGQQARMLYGMRVVQNPYNAQNRQIMNEQYGVSLPMIAERTHQKPTMKPITGSTVDHLAVLPRANRVDPQLAPPAISDEDTRKGILSLLERGLIPPAAELTLDPSPVRHRTAQLHKYVEKDTRGIPPPAVSLTDGYNMASVKLDTVVRLNEMPSLRKTISSARSRDSKSAGSSRASKTPAAMKTFEMPLQPLPPPTTPASGEFKQHNHRFAIQHGKVRDNSAEFQAFKQHYCLTWGNIVTMLKHLQKMLNTYNIPIAFVNGDEVADLSYEYELEKLPTVDDLLGVIVNREDVEALMYKPGQKFLGIGGRDRAATVIQAMYRRYKDRSWYLNYRRRKWAAGVIVISWVMHVKMADVRRGLKQTRLDQLENFRQRSKKLALSWDRIKSSRRVVIHIPSMGYNDRIRRSIADLGIRQNTQMARLCQLTDPNVDVIYVCPVTMNDETLQYYDKLISLKGAINSGNVEDQADLQERYKIIVPDAIKSFPAHKMCLSTHLKYSPRAISRIKNLVRGRNAYIVPGIPHQDDLAVADYLGVPMLAPEPDVAHLYSTKSGSKRIFSSAGVTMPPGEYDIYSLPQLQECLAQLVTENLNVQRWLMKLDCEFDGRGIAYIDVTEHLKCYNWAVKESQRYGEKWSKKWAQEPAYMRILAEIPDILDKFAVPADKDIFPTWEKFIEAFLSQGGIVEACPPSESVTTLTVDMLIEPNGHIEMVNMGDQIHASSPFRCWGLSVPQSSVEADQLNKICYDVADACKSRGVVGYFSVDFATFIDPVSMDQKLWAIDLSLCYSDHLAMTQMMKFVTNATLDTKNHTLDVPLPPKEEKKPAKGRWKYLKKVDEEEEPPNTTRFAITSTRLLHTNLAVVHYSVFFQMCRAHGIGFDVKEKQGTMFTLIDSFHRENMGMLTIGDNLQGALATFARNLSIIHQEISAPNMQGTSNFQAAIEDIEGILGTTIENAGQESSDDESET